MTTACDQVFPWGRSYAEYVAMFALTDSDLRRRILGCGDGPAAFNAELTAQGGNIVSCDPLYQFSAARISGRIHAHAGSTLQRAADNADKFIWKTIRDPAELGKIRMAAMERFLADYVTGNGCYVAAELPDLPFPSHTFNLALCGHFLFLYSHNLSLEFHLAAARELCRVAREIRIFPLVDFDAELSPFVEPVRESLHAAGFRTEIAPVPYEFQRGGNQMLKITG